LDLDLDDDDSIAICKGRLDYPFFFFANNNAEAVASSQTLRKRGGGRRRRRSGGGAAVPVRRKKSEHARLHCTGPHLHETRGAGVRRGTVPSDSQLATHPPYPPIRVFSISSAMMNDDSACDTFVFLFFFLQVLKYIIIRTRVQTFETTCPKKN
jgi:hypothetical protein